MVLLRSNKIICDCGLRMFLSCQHITRESAGSMSDVERWKAGRGGQNAVEPNPKPRVSSAGFGMHRCIDGMKEKTRINFPSLRVDA